MKSKAGEDWAQYYQAETLSWHNPAAHTAESVMNFARSEWIQKMLKAARLAPSQDVKVLEAGCGTAYYSLALALLGFDVEAFDYNEGALRFARQLEEKARRIRPDLKIKIGLNNLLDIQAESNQYDLVFNQAVMEYFCDAKERKRAFSEMIRVAKPGGWVAVITQHTGHPFRGYWEGRGWRGYENQPPVIRQTPRASALELQSYGLTNIFTDGIYPWKAFFFYPQNFMKLTWSKNAVYYLGRVLERVGYIPRPLRAKLALQYLVMGRKP